MNYDENIFKAKANQRARKIWLIFASELWFGYLKRDSQRSVFSDFCTALLDSVLCRTDSFESEGNGDRLL